MSDSRKMLPFSAPGRSDQSGLRSGALAMSAASGFAAEPATPEQEMKFHAFLSDFRAEALKAGINADTYDRATSSIDVNPRVQELNEKQPEFVRPVWEYLADEDPNDGALAEGMRRDEYQEAHHHDRAADSRAAGHRHVPRP